MDSSGISNKTVSLKELFSYMDERSLNAPLFETISNDEVVFCRGDNKEEIGARDFNGRKKNALKGRGGYGQLKRKNSERNAEASRGGTFAAA